MTATLIVLIIITIIALVFLPFFKELMQDRNELEQNPMEKKFQILISRINHLIMDGKGEIIKTEDPRQVNLFSDDQANMLLQFYYSTGTLTIILKYKYFHVELIRKMQFHNMRQAEIFRQQDVANHFVEEARIAIVQHQLKVNKERGVRNDNGEFLFSNIESDIDDKNPIDLIRGMYNNLSNKQKITLVALAEIIFKADGSTSSQFQNHPMFSNLLLSLEVNYDQVTHNFVDMNINNIVQSMTKENKPELMILLMAIIPFLGDNTGPNEQRIEKVYEVFGQMGFTPNQINNEINKMMAFTKFFDKK